MPIYCHHDLAMSTWPVVDVLPLQLVLQFWLLTCIEEAEEAKKDSPKKIDFQNKFHISSSIRIMQLCVMNMLPHKVLCYV